VLTGLLVAHRADGGKKEESSSQAASPSSSGSLLFVLSKRFACAVPSLHSSLVWIACRYLLLSLHLHRLHPLLRFLHPLHVALSLIVLCAPGGGPLNEFGDDDAPKSSNSTGWEARTVEVV
jgi:hypothetical protein